MRAARRPAPNAPQLRRQRAQTRPGPRNPARSPTNGLSGTLRGSGASTLEGMSQVDGARFRRAAMRNWRWAMASVVAVAAAVGDMTVGVAAAADVGGTAAKVVPPAIEKVVSLPAITLKTKGKM